jgi:hypothetical protein
MREKESSSIAPFDLGNGFIELAKRQQKPPGITFTSFGIARIEFHQPLKLLGCPRPVIFKVCFHALPERSALRLPRHPVPTLAKRCLRLRGELLRITGRARP